MNEPSAQEENAYTDNYTWTPSYTNNSSTHYTWDHPTQDPPTTQWDTTSTTGATNNSSSHYIWDTSNPPAQDHYTPANHTERRDEYPSAVPQLEQWVNETSASETTIAERFQRGDWGSS
jgi:hypothetical protein